jgi:protein O-mannosyl-transferase
MDLIFRKIKFPQQWEYFIVLIIVIAVYWPTFNGGFILDDNILVKNNPYITKLHSISSYFSQEDGITDEKDLGDYHTGYYRPLINITYFLDYKIWGMHAYGFRITNLILHLMSCFILFKLIDHIIRDRRTALWCVILFSIHPVNTESVSCIVARNNILAGLFSIASFYYYIISCEKNDHIKTVISAILFFCAIFSKEFGLMILPVFFLYNRFLVGNKRSVISELTSYIPFLIIAICYFFLRHMVIGNFLTPFSDAQIIKRLFFVPYIIALNLKLIFLPHGLHQFNISYPSSFFNMSAVFSIILIIFIGSYLWLIKKNKIVVFSALSFLLVLFPVLSIIPSASTSNALISLRWLYFPLIFIFIGIGYFIKRCLDFNLIIVKIVLCILILYLGLYSYTLNKYHWHSEETFFRQEVLHFNNFLHAGGFAELLYSKGNLLEAEKYFNIAINKLPYQAYNYINYSALLITNQQFIEALRCLDKAKDLLMTHHERGEWFNNRGSALFGLGDRHEALKQFQDAVLFAPYEPMFWANLGVAYAITGDYQNSIDALIKGLEISPDNIQLRANLAMTYIRLNEYQKAISVLENNSNKEAINNSELLRLMKLAREGLQSKRNQLDLSTNDNNGLEAQ